MHLEGDLDILDHSVEFVKLPKRFSSLKKWIECLCLNTLHYRVLATPQHMLKVWTYLLKLDLSHSSRPYLMYLCVQWGRLKNTQDPAIWKLCTIVKLDDSQQGENENICNDNLDNQIITITGGDDPMYTILPIIFDSPESHHIHHITQASTPVQSQNPGYFGSRF